MTSKLTLRIDKTLVAKAKQEAKRRGKSVSGMVADYFAAMGEKAHSADTLPPVTAGEIVARPITDEYIEGMARMTGTRGNLLRALKEEKAKERLL